MSFRTVLLAAAVLSSLASCAEQPQDGPSTVAPEVELVERASGQGTAALETQLRALSSSLDELDARLADLEATVAAATSLERRIATVESQVGVNSPHRNSISSLWSELEKARRCLKEILAAWESNYPPSCIAL